MTSQEVDTLASICIGITAVFCLFAALYMSAYSTQQNSEAAIEQVITSIPYFNKVVDYMDKALSSSDAPILPLHAPALAIKKVVFMNSVATATASPHYEEDFFFADLPLAYEPGAKGR
jgi:hypothetical protein